MAQEDLGSLQILLEVRDMMSAQMKRAEKNVQSFGKQALATASGMLGVGGIQSAFHKIVGAVQSSIKNFMDFEKAMAEVSTLVNTSKVDMKELEVGVIDLSKKYGQDAGGLAKALYQTVSAGVDAGKSIQFLESATKLAIGGVTDTKTAVDALTSALNAYGMDAKDVDQISDSLFTTVKLGKTTIAELSPVIGQVAPLASAAGVKLDEMNSALATMTLTGLSTTEAGTALRGMLTGLIKPTDDAKTTAKALGIEFSTEAIRAKGLAGFLEDVKEKTQGSERAIAALFPNIRGMNAILQLTSDTGIKNFTNAMVEMKDKTGAAEVATEKMKETIGFKWDVIKTKVVEVGKEIVSSVLTPFSDMINKSKELEKIKLLDDKELRENKQLLLETKEAIRDQQDEIKRLDFYKASGRDKLKAEAREEIKRLEDGMKAIESAIKMREKELIVKENIKKINDQQLVDDKKHIKIIEGKNIADGEYAKTEEETAEQKLKNINALMDKIEESSDKEEKSIEKLAKLKEDKLKNISEIEKMAQEMTSRIRIASYNEQEELYNKEAQNSENTETKKLNNFIKASEIRIQKFEFEKSEALKQLDIIKNERLKGYEKDKETIEAVDEMYKASSDQIEKDFNIKLSKELQIQGEATIKLNQSMWDRLETNIHNNFERWADDLRNGSTAAWSGLIGDVNDVVFSIGDMFGGLSDEVEKPLNDLTNLITKAISGNPIQTAVAGLKLIGDAIGLTGKKSKEAAEAQKQVAMDARIASREFLKAAGREDLSSKSLNELSDIQFKRAVELSKAIDPYINVDPKVMQKDYERMLKVQREGDKDNYEQIKKVYGIDLSKDLSYEDFYIKYLSAKLGISPSGELDENITDTIKKKGTAAQSKLALDMLQSFSEVTKEISGFDLTNLDPTRAISYTQAKQILDIMLSQGMIDDTDYKTKLKEQFNKYKDDFNREEYFDELDYIQNLAKGGIARRSTVARIAEAGVPEAVVPLNRINELLKNVTQTIPSGSDGMNINVDMSGYTGSMNSSSAQEIGYIIGDSIAVRLRAEGKR